MMTFALLVLILTVGFFWLMLWLGRQAAQNPSATTELGVRLGKWLMK
jgi:hypothetical protein